MQQSCYTKEETVDFIKYLREKENPLIESQIIYRKSFFNHRYRDMSDRARDMLRKIKGAESPAEAYKTIAHDGAKTNSLWKTVEGAGYMFSEDFDDFIAAFGDEIPPKIAKWRDNQGNGTLESRSVIFEHFPTEYVTYLSGKFGIKKGDFTTYEIDKNGIYPGYRREAEFLKRIGKENVPMQKNHVVIGIKSADGTINAEDFLPLAKYVCNTTGTEEVRITDFDSDTVILVKKAVKE